MPGFTTKIVGNFSFVFLHAFYNCPGSLGDVTQYGSRDGDRYLGHGEEKYMDGLGARNHVGTRDQHSHISLGYFASVLVCVPTKPSAL